MAVKVTRLSWQIVLAEAAIFTEETTMGVTVMDMILEAATGSITQAASLVIVQMT